MRREFEKHKNIVLIIGVILFSSLALMLIAINTSSLNTLGSSTNNFGKNSSDIERQKSNNTEIKTDENLSDNRVKKRAMADISGAVLKPGFYDVGEDARVGDLLILAGGLTGFADKKFVEKNINLSKKVSDEDKIYIPYKGENVQSEVLSSTSVGASRTAATIKTNAETVEGKVNVNKASLEILDKQLPGIGPAYAQKIIENRPYYSYDDLVKKSKINKTTLERIKKLIVF